MFIEANQKLVAANWVVAFMASFAASIMILIYAGSWISSQPIEELPTSILEDNPPPEYARTFRDSRGRVFFYARAPISETPVSFGLSIVAFILASSVFKKIAQRTELELENAGVAAARHILIVPGFIAIQLAIRLMPDQYM